MEKDFYKTYFEVEKNHWWFRVRRNLIFDLLSKYRIKKESKILDFGCGSGFGAGELQHQGFNVFGVDVSEEAIEFGRSRAIQNLSVSKGDNLNFAEGSFDMVMALDVIEHVKDDEHAIKEIERVLKPGAVAIITVPAYQWMWGVQDNISHHFRRYTAGSLAKVLNKNFDLKILRKTYFNTFLFPPIAVVRILSKWFNLKERESDFDINSKWLNKPFFFIFDLERKFLRHINFPFGVSILLVAEKNDNYSQK